ncbi:MAG TPA: 2-oxo-4-hydroxy-4-carboxy-5-ureidoimidazoline decarboxylase [Vicinamibacterales bacterium]|nr:2-oxo-4-hydroxy-4-carboxy-5-ureidoimidazoline decarboxylase [Vicinamibacterales bacterium]
MDTWKALDAATAAEARALLLAACGSERWATRMLEHRPFGSRDALLARAREVWFSLAEEDWREAFRHHPQIGDRDALRRRFPATHHLSEREQAGVADAGSDILAALAADNQKYVDTFGYIFIVCATGKSAGEVLALLRDRLDNDPRAEIRIAAEEQARITALRLA